MARTEEERRRTSRTLRKEKNICEFALRYFRRKERGGGKPWEMTRGDVSATMSGNLETGLRRVCSDYSDC